MSDWLLLHYKLPVRPSARRVFVWRKLKRLGAILLNDAVWVLPDTPRTAEHLQWLSAEIKEMKGNAFLWRSNLVLGVQENDLVEQFNLQVQSQYKRLLKDLNRKNVDLTALSRQYQQIVGQDYFHSELGQQVREALLSLKGEKA